MATKEKKAFVERLLLLTHLDTNPATKWCFVQLIGVEHVPHSHLGVDIARDQWTNVEEYLVDLSPKRENSETRMLVFSEHG